MTDGRLIRSVILRGAFEQEISPLIDDSRFVHCQKSYEPRQNNGKRQVQTQRRTDYTYFKKNVSGHQKEVYDISFEGRDIETERLCIL